MVKQLSNQEKTNEIINFIQGNLIRNINEHKPLSLIDALNITFYQMTGDTKKLIKHVIEVAPRSLDAKISFGLHGDSKGLDVDIKLIFDFAKKIAFEHGFPTHDNGNFVSQIQYKNY